MMSTEEMNRTTVAVGGFSSEVGKTALVCDLLRAFPGWEAIKITRGHYRSCGKTASACCVSHLLTSEPVIYSGRDETYVPGKDTGRYWDAGASNVHWVIVTDAQVEQGIKRALERVRARGLIIEGNSFLRFIDVDYVLMAARAGGGKIKASARRALAQTDALYLFDEASDEGTLARFASWRETSSERGILALLPVYTRRDLPFLIKRLNEIHAARVARPLMT
jgi:hypothetical protein